MNTNNEDIGKRIKEVRTSAKLSQEELGDILGVEKASVSKYEAGGAKRGVPIEHLKKIADLGDKSLDWLITGEEPPERVRYDFESEEQEQAAITKMNGLIREAEMVQAYTPVTLASEEATLVNFYRSMADKGRALLMYTAQLMTKEHPRAKEAQI